LPTAKHDPLPARGTKKRTGLGKKNKKYAEVIVCSEFGLCKSQE